MANAVSTAIGMVVRRGREVRYQPYWEKKTISTGVSDLSYFTTLPTSADLGNMQVAGQFPAPRQYKILGFAVFVHIIGVIADTANFVKSIRNILQTVFILTIADKEYLRFPGWMAAGGGGVHTGTGPAAPSQESFIQGGHPLTYNYLRLPIPITIPMQQNFAVRQTWGAIAAGVGTGVDCTVSMYGVEERAIQ